MENPERQSTKARAFFSRTVLTFALFAVVGVSGCVDLAAIREFTSRAPDTGTYTDLTRGYLGHFDHLKRYRDPTKWGELDGLAAQRKKQERGLYALHRGMVEYLDAIGTLASDETVSYDESLGGLTVAIRETGMVDESHVNAFASLSGFIARAATDGYRRRKLQQFITLGNEPFQKIAAALTNIVGRDFVRELNSEISEIDGYYSETIATAKDTKSPLFDIEALKDKALAALQPPSWQKEDCLTYAATLQAIAEAHQRLFDRRNQLASPDTLQMIYGYSQEIKALRLKLRKGGAL